MTRGCTSALVVIALAVCLSLRFARLNVRPMHHDEANQAVKFGTLLERGEYRYDANDHHGPTLYYLTLPAAWLRGQGTLASLDEYTLRGVTAVFGAAALLLLPLLSSGIGRTAVAAGAILMALSPAMVFYSRMFIQESLFACFTLAFVIAIGRVMTGGGLVWSTLAGVAAGLAVATKETSVIVLPSALAAGAFASWSLGPDRPRHRLAEGRWRVAAAVTLASAAAVAALFYSSFFTAPGGLLDPFRGARTYVDRGVAPISHAHPWHYYVGLLTYTSSEGVQWSEGLVLVLAITGALTAWGLPRAASRGRPERGADRLRQGYGGPPKLYAKAEAPPPHRWSPGRAFWARYLTCYLAVTAAIFSAIPYKTPWNLLPFYVAAIVLAGIGFSRLLHATTSRALAAVLVAGCLAASVHLGWQAWRASVTYASDPRNPYVYAQTVPDAVRMSTRIRELAALHPDGARMQVSVIASPYEQWPLPWYLRTMPNVGYWTAPGDPLAMQAPVVVASMEHSAVFDALEDRYVSEFFGLRPEVLLTLYVDRGLWERFLDKASGDPSEVACLAAGRPLPERCRHTSTVALWATSVP
jgi:uncharacterized protein (TIGR03663 family)